MKTKKQLVTNSNGRGSVGDMLSQTDREIIVNAFLSRAEFMKNALDGPRRDLYSECQYPRSIDIKAYKEMYERNPFGKRVCRVWPSETWKLLPEVYEVEDIEETAFEKAWKKLQIQCQIYHYLKLIDELSGIGHYGVLFLGVDDGKPLDEPISSLSDDGEERVEEEEPVNLIYLRAFDEELAQITAYETNQRNIRYGRPLYYDITFDNVDTQEQFGKTIPMDRKVTVHWSRVVHIAPDCTTSVVWGTPRQKSVFNNLLDIRKVLGGSAEMFWKGAFPGWSFETHPDAASNGDLDIESIRAQVERWESGLQRYFTGLGLTVKSLAPQVEDPRNHLESQVEAITTVLEMPKRVFLGSEIGELASSQDKATWNDRVHAKQEDHTTPVVVRPLVSRLIKIGALPYVDPDEIKVHWPDLNAPSGKDKAEVAGKLTDALYKYVVGGCHVVIPPEEYLGIVWKMDVSEVQAIMEAAMASIEGENDVDPMMIKDEQMLEQQMEQEDRQFQKQKELTRVKQRQGRQPTQKSQPTQPVNNKRKKKLVAYLE